MSAKSRQRQIERIGAVNRATPEWAARQIARQIAEHEALLNRANGLQDEAPANVTNLNPRLAAAVLMGIAAENQLAAKRENADRLLTCAAL